MDYILFPGQNGRATRVKIVDTGDKALDGKPVYALVMVPDDGTALPAGTNLLGSIQDNGPAWTTIRSRLSSADASGADADLIAAGGTGKKSVITDLIVAVAANMTVTIKEETSGTVLAVFDMLAHTTVVWRLRGKLIQPTANKKILARASAAGQVEITALSYTE